MVSIFYTKDWGHFAKVFELNMDYYNIKFDADAQKLCTIVFPWHMEN
jgi:hypothetical protein